MPQKKIKDIEIHGIITEEGDDAIIVEPLQPVVLKLGKKTYKASYIRMERTKE